MSKYVRTEDGVMTVTQFAIYLLGEKYNADRAGVSIDLDGKIEYQYTVTRKERTGHSRRSKSICFRTAYFSKSEDEVLKMVEETPNRKADNLYELFDQVVAIFNYGEGKEGRVVHDTVCSSCWQDQCKKLSCNGAFRLLGAIWTDKGLIYVAKMNEKGEFELL